MEGDEQCMQEMLDMLRNMEKKDLTLRDVINYQFDNALNDVVAKAVVDVKKAYDEVVHTRQQIKEVLENEIKWKWEGWCYHIGIIYIYSWMGTVNDRILLIIINTSI